MGKYLKIMGLALVVGLWVLAGCGRQAVYAPDGTGYDLYEAVIYAPEPDGLVCFECLFAPIINAFAELEQSGFTHIEPIIESLNFFQATIMFPYTFAYSFADINNTGVPELLIGGIRFPPISDGYRILSIWTLIDGVPTPVIELSSHRTFSEGLTFDINGNIIIPTSWSHMGRAFDNFFTINPTDGSLILLESLGTQILPPDSGNRDEYKLRRTRLGDGEFVEITEEEYIALLENYGASGFSPERETQRREVPLEWRLVTCAANDKTQSPYLQNIESPYSAFDLFRSVLLNERTFRCKWRGDVYFDDSRYEVTGHGTENIQVAVIDMNADGIPEVIINMRYIIKLVLHYYNGEIFGHEFGIRSMSGITTDGTFMNSSGVGQWGIARLEFDGGSYEYINLYNADFTFDEHSREVTLLLNGEEVSEDELNAVLSTKRSKELIEWYPFTEGNMILRDIGTVPDTGGRFSCVAPNAKNESLK